MKYKVGDRVRIRSKEWYDKHKDECGEIKGAFFDKDRAKLCGTIQTIANKGFIDGSGVIIYAVEDACEFIGEEAIEGLVEDDERLFERAADAFKKVDEMMEARYQKNKTYYSGEQWSTEFECPNGYIFKDENGNEIHATKIVLEKKKKEYPKTYAECCKVMNYCCNPVATKTIHKEELIRKFQFLLLYRDAYWKLYGEEIGLGKPWEPDWNDTYVKYCLERDFDAIDKTVSNHKGRTFAFPTEELRDAFYENFKDLIEQCKELL